MSSKPKLKRKKGGRVLTLQDLGRKVVKEAHKRTSKLRTRIAKKPDEYSPIGKGGYKVICYGAGGGGGKGSSQENIRKQPWYTCFKIQPAVFCGLNRLGGFETAIIKYICRYPIKNGVEDLKKARHYIDMLIEREEKGTITL